MAVIITAPPTYVQGPGCTPPSTSHPACWVDTLKVFYIWALFGESSVYQLGATNALFHGLGVVVAYQ